MNSKWTDAGKVLALKSDIVAVIQNNKGTTAPSTPAQGEAWVDSANDIIQWYTSNTDWLMTVLGNAMKRTTDKTNGPFLNELVDSKNSIADHTVTTFLNISVPNKDTSAMIIIDYVVNSDKGAGYYRTGQLRINIARNEDANTNTDINESMTGEVTPSTDIGPVTSGTTNDKIYQHTRWSSAIADSFSSPSDAPTGIVYYGGTTLYTSDSNSNKIYQHSGFTSDITDSFSSPSDACAGIAFDGTDIYSVDSNSDKIYRHSGFTSNITDSFSSPSSTPRGIAWDTANSCIISADNNQKIYKHSGFSSTISDSFSTGKANLKGVAVMDGDILAVAGNKIFRYAGFSSNMIDSFSHPEATAYGIDYSVYTDGDMDNVYFQMGSLSGAAGATQTSPVQVFIKSILSNTANIRYYARILSGGYQDAESGCEVTLAAV